MKVITWLWSQPGGRSVYQPWHVRIWASMIRRNLTLPHTLAVVTDIPGDYGDVEVIPPPGEFEDVRIPTWAEGRPQCLRRLSMFRKDAAGLFGTDRIVCTDLDLVVCASLDTLLDIKEDFKITKGTAKNRRYNGSMMSLKLGSRPQVYDEFTPEAAVLAGRSHVGSDQAWLARIIPNESTWTPNDGVLFWGYHPQGQQARVVFFAGHQKPWALASVGKEKLVNEHYRADRNDRCLILGYGPSVWDDADQALDEYEFAAVIASPEAAVHWPDPVLAVADNDEHAERLARMHGFKEIVFCGRSGGVAAHAEGA
jgi:hypothetical protein